MHWLASFRTMLENTDWLLSYSSQKYFSIKKEYAFKSTTVGNRKACAWVILCPTLQDVHQHSRVSVPHLYPEGAGPSLVQQDLADRNLDTALLADCTLDEASAIIPSLVNAVDQIRQEEPQGSPGGMPCWILCCGFDMA